jgi:hypothetical protein
MGSYITALPVKHPLFWVFHHTSFGAFPQEFPERHSVDFGRVWHLLLQLAFKHFPAQLITVLKPLYYGITEFFIGW